MTFSALRFRTFCHATEDETRVRKALDFVTGCAPIAVSITEGHHGNRICILETQLTKKKEIEQFWSRFADAGLLAKLLENIDERIGDDLALGIRFDKQHAYAGRLAFDDGGDVIHVRARIVAHPAKRENALAAVQDYFGRMTSR